MLPSKPAISFIPVKTNIEKQAVLCQTIHNLFLKGKKILILLPNETAADYLDKLLWKFPTESFCPHVIASTPSDERIVLSIAHQNWNNADVLVNLCLEVPAIYSQFSEVYELFDQTTPDKENQSLEKKKAYHL